MNKPTTENAVAFLAKNPTFIGRVNGTDLYEHPVYGDEAPLVAITSDGKKRATTDYELPSAADGVSFR